jgi:hypothetical protein
MVKFRTDAGRYTPLDARDTPTLSEDYQSRK